MLSRGGAMYYSLAELQGTIGLISGFVGGTVAAALGVVVWQGLLPKQKAGWGATSLFWSAIYLASNLTSALFHHFKISGFESRHSILNAQNFISIFEFPSREPNLFLSLAVVLAYCIPLCLFLLMRFKGSCVIASMAISLCCWWLFYTLMGNLLQGFA